MTTLEVALLSATVHPGVEDPDRVSALHTRLADRALPEAAELLGSVEGHWCVRRLQVTHELDPTCSEGDSAAAWARSLVTTLEGELAAGSPEVLHFAHLGRALTDLLSGLARGETGHAWAWHQLDLCDGGDLAADGSANASSAAGAAPETAPALRRIALAALTRHPSHVLGAILSTLAGEGFPALHRLLGRDGWVRAAELVSQAHGWTYPPAYALSEPVRRTDGAPDGAPPNRPAAAAPTPRAAWAAASSTLAGAALGSGLRSDPPTALAWAVLVLAETDPGAGSDETLAHQVAARLLPPRREVASGPGNPVDRLPSRGLQLPTGTPGPSGPRVRPAAAPDAVGARPPATPADRSLEPAVRRTSPQDQPSFPPAGQPSTAHGGPGTQPATPPTPAELPSTEPDPTEPDPTGSPTRWAGLLFLLNLAVPAGVVEQAQHDARLDQRSLRWILRQVAADLVPIEPDDPAARALAGLAAGQPVPAGRGITEVEAAAVTALADRWAVATQRRLVARSTVPQDWTEREPRAVVAAVAERWGMVSAEPGWIEVVLDLADVDLDLRRAGLDLDPGWLPWLGAVVRFRYV